MASQLQPFSWERVFEAHHRVRSRLMRTVGALQNADILYAMAGDHAAAHWVGTVEPAAVRNVVDIILVVQRSDFPAIRVALQSVGLVETENATKTIFVESSTRKLRESVELLFEGDLVRPGESWKIPSPAMRLRFPGFDVLNVNSLAMLFSIEL